VHRIAYVTARYPPMRSSGTYRVEAMIKHLPESGFDLQPVTIPDAWMRQQSGRDLPPVDDPRVLQPDGKFDGLIRLLADVPVARRVLREALVPDILAPWSRAVTEGLIDTLRGAEAVYATGPPFSALMLGDDLARELGVPIVQEVRDPPSFNRRLVGRSRSWKKRMLKFESSYLPAADVVVAVTPGSRRRLLELHPDIDPQRCVVVMNGYPDIEPDPTKSRRRPDQFTVTYVGSFQGGAGSRKESLFTPAAVLPALDGLGRVSLRVVGPATEEQKRTISETEGGQLVTFTGLVDRATAVAEVAAADVALVLAESEDWWIGRKVFEYLAFAKRILALVPESGDTAELLKSHSKAVVVEPGAENQIRMAVEKLYDDWAKGLPPPADDVEGVQTDQRCAQQIAEVLRNLLSSRQASSRKD
jgi:hypothetical protein